MRLSYSSTWELRAKLGVPQILRFVVDFLTKIKTLNKNYVLFQDRYGGKRTGGKFQGDIMNKHQTLDARQTYSEVQYFNLGLSVR